MCDSGYQSCDSETLSHEFAELRVSALRLEVIASDALEPCSTGKRVDWNPSRRTAIRDAIRESTTESVGAPTER